jgi:hypothetical protein
VVWPEVIAALSEGPWLRQNLPELRANRLDPHILAQARTILLESGSLVEDRATLNSREVTAYLDGAGLAQRRTTAIRETARAKRRLYRSYLGWTANSGLCGHAAEAVVGATLDQLAGSVVWLPPDMQLGQVRRLRGRPLAGGPLDAAGFIPFDPVDPPAGMASFAVEVKNIRGWLYPWSHEVWDLIAKLGDFPDVVPILIARRIHVTTFRMFKDIGAIGFDARRQWFRRRAGDHSIDPVTFERVREAFGFHDAELLDATAPPHPPLRTFFETRLQAVPEGQSSSLIERASQRWHQVAAIAGDYVNLRAERMDGTDRRELLGDFAARLVDAGLMETGGWARLPIEYYRTDEEPDWEPDE